MSLFVKILFFGAAVFFIDQLGLWAERSGHLYWRHKKPEKSSNGNALMTLEAAFNPRARHMIEVSQKEESKNLDDPSGDDKDKLKLLIKNQAL